VEYIDDSNRSVPLRATASRLVVVSGGAFGSPAILERSGIGSNAVLSKLGIQVLVDLPGVGENYNGSSFELKRQARELKYSFFSDHQVCGPGYLTDSEVECFDSITFGYADPDFMKRESTFKALTPSSIGHLEEELAFQKDGSGFFAHK
jgi:choline dehydrogenase-like flavoprotein